MKFTIFFCLLTMTIHAQSTDESISLKKNSFGLTISTESIGNSSNLNETPTIGLDFRRLITNNNELRLSLGYQHSTSDLYKNSFSISAGLNHYLYKNNKVGIYGGAELNYNNFSSVAYIVEPRIINAHTTDQFGLNFLMGIEYNPSSRISLFLEPQLMFFSIFESANSQSSFQTNNLKFLKGSQVGIKYRF